MHETQFHDPADWAVFVHHPVDDLEPLPESELRGMGNALGTVLVWVTEARARNVSGLRHHKVTTLKYFCASKADLRLMAFVYCLRPDLVECTLRGMARRIGCSPEGLRKHVDNFRRTFGFRTPGQWSPESRLKLKSTALARYQQRRLALAQRSSCPPSPSP